MIDREDFIKSMSFDALLEMFKNTKDPERISAMYYVWRHFEMSCEELYGLEYVKSKYIRRLTDFEIPICEKALEKIEAYNIGVNRDASCVVALSTTYMTLCSVAEYLMKEHIIYLSSLDNCDLSKTSQRALVFVAHHFKDFHENKRWNNLADAHVLETKVDDEIWGGDEAHWRYFRNVDLSDNLRKIGVYFHPTKDTWWTTSANIKRIFDEINRRVK